MKLIIYLIPSRCSQGISYIHKVGIEPLQYKTIGQLLQLSADKYAGRDALVSCHEKTRITFSDTLEKVNKTSVIFYLLFKLILLFLKADQLAAGLLNLGLNKGDRVAIFSPNFTFWYISFMAIARASLISV